MIFYKYKSYLGTPVIVTVAAAAVKLLQLCPTLWNPIDSSPLGSSVPGILQARILEWVAISFSSAWKWKVKVKSLSHVWLLLTHGLQPTRLLRPWHFPGKSTGVGCHCLLRLLYFKIWTFCMVVWTLQHSYILTLVKRWFNHLIFILKIPYFNYI